MSISITGVEVQCVYTNTGNSSVARGIFSKFLFSGLFGLRQPGLSLYIAARIAHLQIVLWRIKY